MSRTTIPTIKKKETEDKPKQLEQMINTIRRALAFSQAE